MLDSPANDNVPQPIKITTLGNGSRLFVYDTEENCEKALENMGFGALSAEIIMIDEEWRGLMLYND